MLYIWLVENRKEIKSLSAHGFKDAYIAGIGMSVPYPVSTKRFLEVDTELRKKFNQPDKIINRVKQIKRIS